MLRASFLCVLVLACGGRGPRTPKAGATYYWSVCASRVEFKESCSDDPAFRTATGPLDQIGSHLIYRVAADGRTATMMACKSTDPTSCAPAANGVVFTVSGAELSYASDERTATGFGNCNLASAWSWTLTDWTTSLDVVISNTLSLVDDPIACEMVEQAAIARSPNMKGFRGCTITFTLGTVPFDKNC